MTVPANSRRREYQGNGVTKTFNGPMVQASGQMRAYLVKDGARTVVTDFNVGRVGFPSGTRVTLNVAPAVGEVLLLLRVVDYSQETDITNQSAFHAETIENGFDDLEMQIQQMDDGVSRSVKLRETFVGTPPDLTLPDPESSKIIGWNYAANALRNTDISGPADLLLRSDLGDPTGGGLLVAFKQVGAGAVSRSVMDKLREFVSVRDFGALGDGVADDTLAFTRALAASDDVRVPPGTYRTTSTITLAGKRLIGAGRGTSTISCATANAPVITISASTRQNVVESMTISHSVTAVSGGDGIRAVGMTAKTRIEDVHSTFNFVGFHLGPCDYNTVSWCLADNNQSHGFVRTNASATGPAQWYLLHCLSQNNVGHGFADLGGTNGVMSIGALASCATYANSGYGYYANAANTANKIAAIRIADCFFGEDGSGEMYFNTFGGVHRINCTYIEMAGISPTGPLGVTPATNSSYGVQLTVNNDSVYFTDCDIIDNTWSGMFNECPLVSMSNCRIYDNGQSSTPNRNYGVHNAATSGVLQISGGRCGNRQGSTKQALGLYTATDTVQVSFVDFSGNTSQGLLSNVPLVNSVVLGNIASSAVANIIENTQFREGVAVGSAVGGFTGTGTINVAGGLLKNNSPYANP